MALDETRIWTKDPGSTLSVGLWWRDVPARGGKLQSVAWVVPAGLNKISEGINTTTLVDDGITYPIGQVALVRLSGGTAGADVDIVCRITTTGGDVDERTITVRVRDL